MAKAEGEWNCNCITYTCCIEKAVMNRLAVFDGGEQGLGLYAWSRHGVNR